LVRLASSIERWSGLASVEPSKESGLVEAGCERPAVHQCHGKIGRGF
jgi:hypothetical protein